jgi:hypothetical protein
MTRVGKGEPLDRKVGNPDIDTRFGVTSELAVTRPELWETKISRFHGQPRSMSASAISHSSTEQADPLGVTVVAYT